MISIKGLNSNLVFVFDQGSFSDLKQALEEKLEANRDFFGGSQVLFKGEGLAGLTQEELITLQKLCLDYGLTLNNYAPIPSPADKPSSKDVIVYRNVRSGQKIRSEGSVVVWGDVHESAEIIAGQDVVVLGKLEGIVHAGAYGDRNSVVFALSLAPGQIRIADQLSRIPSDYVRKNKPEVAYLDEQGICISEYKPRDTLARMNLTIS